MNLKIKSVSDLMEQKDLTIEALSVRSGVDERSVRWAMDGEPVSVPFAERIAGVLGVQPKEIVRKESLTYNENFIEFLTGGEHACATFTQKRMISSIRKYAKKKPDECRIIAENGDGSIVVSVPVTWVKVSPPRKVEMTDEQRRAAAERLRDNRKTAVE